MPIAMLCPCCHTCPPVRYIVRPPLSPLRVDVFGIQWNIQPRMFNQAGNIQPQVLAPLFVLHLLIPNIFWVFLFPNLPKVFI